MSLDVSLSCKCGSIRGVARRTSPSVVSRFVCHCADCATFAEVLDRADVLDRDGGSDIVQTAPAWVTFQQGHEQLRCLRLSPKGLHRWYAGCCHTLIANTMGLKSGFVGLLSEMMHPPAGKSLDDVVGPVMAHVNGRAAGRPMPPHVHPRVPPARLLQVVTTRIPRWLAAGRTSPFAKAPADGTRVLTKDERQTAREAAIRRDGHAGTPSPRA